MSKKVLLTSFEAARFLGIPRKKLYNWVFTERVIPLECVVPVSDGIYFKRAVLEQWLSGETNNTFGDVFK